MCSQLNPSPPSFLSHCVTSWLHHTGNKQLDRYIWVKFVFFASWHCSVLPLLPFGQPKSHHSAESNSYLAHTFFCRMWLLWTLKYTQGLFALPQKSPLHQQPRMHPWGHTHIPCNDETGRDSSVPEGRSCFCSLHFQGDDMDVSYH